MIKNNNYILSKSEVKEGVSIALPASKSIANRAIIVNSLSGGKARLQNISNARDTQLMLSLINSDEEIINPMDAGTTMRFLTAYFAVTNQKKTLTGTERMQQRPIKILVEALKGLGADIEYLGNEGYPPLKLNGFPKQLTNVLEVDAQISSQYISALMMIGPNLPEGLRLVLKGKIGSRPYIEMTKKVMEAFGAELSFEGNVIEIKNKGYKGAESYAIEPDWSAASYWYSLVALQKNTKVQLRLNGVSEKSIQGDHVIQHIMEKMGVKSSYDDQGVLLSNSGNCAEVIQWDFTDCPDLAQTVAVASGALGIETRMTGLESLRIKETDRIAALQNELIKFGVTFQEENGQWVVKSKKDIPTDEVSIETYEDHRMAMAFMPLCTYTPLVINDLSVVNKSYPHFWDDVEMALDKV